MNYIHTIERLRSSHNSSSTIKEFLLNHIPFIYEGDTIVASCTRFYHHNTLLNIFSSENELDLSLRRMVNTLKRTMNKTMTYSCLKVNTSLQDNLLLVQVDMGISDATIMDIAKALTMEDSLPNTQELIYEYIRECVDVNVDARYFGDIPIRNGKIHQNVTKINKRDDRTVYIHYIRDIISWIQRSTIDNEYASLTITIQTLSKELLLSMSFQT